MVTTVEILALSPGLPRPDLAAQQLGTAEQARSELQQLFPGRIRAGRPMGDVRCGWGSPIGTIYAGTYGATTLICGSDLIEIVDLGTAVQAIGHGRVALRVQLNSVLDAAALDITDAAGGVVRELMVTNDDGVIFDSGPRLDFEWPFWSGSRDPGGVQAATFGSEMPFRPMEFGVEAVRTLFGFAIGATVRPGGLESADLESADLDAGAIALYGFEIAPALPVGTRSATSTESTLPLQDGATPEATTPDSARDGAPAPPPIAWWRRVWQALGGS